MSKAQRRQKDFPPLQKRIILYLAENGPQNINQTKKDIKGHYKSSWIAFDTLKKKSLIKEVASKPYHGKEYPQFWVTEAGIFLALSSQEVKPRTLLKRTLEVYPENTALQFLIETAPILGKNAFDVLYLAAITNGQIEQTDIDSIYAKQMRTKFTPEIITQFIKVAKKYPQQYQKIVDSVNQTQKKLSQLSHLLQ